MLLINFLIAQFDANMKTTIALVIVASNRKLQSVQS